MTVRSGCCEALHARQRQHQSRIAERRWTYRQRSCAKGAWPRLCRVLADAERAYAISEADLTQLLAEGHQLLSVGAELNPAKNLVVVSAERAQALRSREEIPVRLSAPLLRAERVALVPFA